MEAGWAAVRGLRLTHNAATHNAAAAAELLELHSACVDDNKPSQTHLLVDRIT